MKIKLIFHGHLKKYNNDIPILEMEIHKTITVDQLVTRTRIPTDEIAFVAINRSRVTNDTIIQEGDEIKIFQLVGGG